jgi:hypothetical protein
LDTHKNGSLTPKGREQMSSRRGGFLSARDWSSRGRPDELAALHSITSSASSGNGSRIESPKALAALRLTRSIREVTATFPAWDDWSCQTLQTGAILTV